EVSQSMGSAPSDKEQVSRMSAMHDWELVAGEETGGPPYEKLEVWLDRPVAISVGYRDGKTIWKAMLTLVPPWKVKTREWERRIRGLPVWYSGRENSRPSW